MIRLADGNVPVKKQFLFGGCQDGHLQFSFAVRALAFRTDTPVRTQFENTTDTTYMNFKALTIAREYGSGGAEIAGIVASRLGWRLVDQALLTEVSSKAKVPTRKVAELDEQTDPWLYRLMRRLWGTGGDGFSAIMSVDFFDADSVAALTKLVIQEAYIVGRCVIVGRGAQCVLRGKQDVFHAFVYAGWSDRVNRVQGRVAPGTKVDELIRSMDASRLEYVRRHYGVNRLDPHLYDLLVNSNDQIEAVARLILSAMEITR